MHNPISGVVELADLDGPFVKLSLRGRFWHKRSTVLARIANYLKQRIPVSLLCFFSNTQVNYYCAKLNTYITCVLALLNALVSGDFGG